MRLCRRLNTRMYHEDHSLHLLLKSRSIPVVGTEERTCAAGQLQPVNDDRHVCG